MFFTEVIKLDYQEYQSISFWDAFWDKGWIFALGAFILFFAVMFTSNREDLSVFADILLSAVSGLLIAAMVGCLSSVAIGVDSYRDNMRSVDESNMTAKATAKEAAEDRIFGKYSLDDDSLKFKHTISEKILTESSTTYNDLENNIRYELIFAFDKDGQPNLMKTAQVTDALVAKLEK